MTALRYEDLEQKAQAARGNVFKDMSLTTHERRLFDEYYRVQMGAVKARLSLRNPDKAQALERSIGYEFERMDKLLERESPEVRHNVGRAMGMWKSRMDPSIMAEATKGFYNEDDKNYSIGGGYQMDGLAGGAVGGGLGYLIADKLGLSWVWKTLLTAASAIAGALLTNKATDAIHGTTVPEKPEIPEGTPPAPKPEKITPAEPAPMGNPYAQPNIPFGGFHQHPQIPSGGRNRAGNWGAEHYNWRRYAVPNAPSAAIPGTPLQPGTRWPYYNGPVQGDQFHLDQYRTPQVVPPPSVNPPFNNAPVVNPWFTATDVPSAPEAPQNTPAIASADKTKNKGMESLT
jgi:hypothetical protein